MSNPQKLNYIVLSDGSFYRVFERLGKNVPFEAYNPNKHLGIGTSFEDALSIIEFVESAFPNKVDSNLYYHKL